MTDAPVTEEKKPQAIPIDDDNDVDDSDEEGAPEMAAADGQFYTVFLLSTANNTMLPNASLLDQVR